MNVVCVMTRNFINSMKLEKGMCQYLGTQTAMAFSAQTNRYQTKSPLLLVKPSLCPWFRLKSWCMSRVRMWASDWSVQDVPGTVPLQGTVWRLGTVTKFQRHFRESGDWNNTACGFFLPWYLGRWRCLMVRISPFTSIGHQKNTWTYPTNIVFLQFLPVFLPWSIRVSSNLREHQFKTGFNPRKQDTRNSWIFNHLEFFVQLHGVWFNRVKTHRFSHQQRWGFGDIHPAGKIMVLQAPDVLSVTIPTYWLSSFAVLSGACKPCWQPIYDPNRVYLNTDSGIVSCSWFQLKSGDQHETLLKNTWVSHQPLESMVCPHSPTVPAAASCALYSVDRDRACTGTRLRVKWKELIQEIHQRFRCKS